MHGKGSGRQAVFRAKHCLIEICPVGSETCALEELIAELGAALACARRYIATEPRRDHAPYGGFWLKVLRNDPRAIFTASSKAEEATIFFARISCETAKSGAMVTDFVAQMGFSEILT